MRKKIVEPEIPLKINKALRRVYALSLLVVVGMGIYTSMTNSGFGFTMYGRYGGAGSQMTFGPFEYFMLAGILILFGILYWFIDGPKKS